jgi:hypothetical protein
LALVGFSLVVLTVVTVITLLILGRYLHPLPGVLGWIYGLGLPLSVFAAAIELWIGFGVVTVVILTAFVIGLIHWRKSHGDLT